MTPSIIVLIALIVLALFLLAAVVLLIGISARLTLTLDHLLENSSAISMYLRRKELRDIHANTTKEE
jgi:uncharacterized protein YoxC